MYLILTHNKFVSPQIIHVYISFIYKCSIERESHLEKDNTLELGRMSSMHWDGCPNYGAAFASPCELSFTWHRSPAPLSPRPGPVSGSFHRYHCNIGGIETDGERGADFWQWEVVSPHVPALCRQQGKGNGPASGGVRFPACSFEGRVEYINF